MTTLSKEDVVRMAKEAFACQFTSLPVSESRLQSFAALARADIVEANKALVAENERLKATPPDQRQDLHCVVSDISAECRELRTALAAAEADNERLREALSMHIHLVESNAPELSGKAHGFAKDALAKPRDDSALREMIAGVYEECAKGCRKEAVVIVVDGPEERAYNNAISDCELAIRALAEKAKGK